MNKQLIFFLLFFPLKGFTGISAECNFNSADYLDQLSNLKNLKRVEIEIKKYKKWTTNVLEAVLQEKAILPKYKKKFDAQIVSFYAFGSCTHSGKVRLHGDWKDHIDFNEGGNLRQSVDVSLESGSIANIVKFKLLIPETRNGKNEVLLTSLLRLLKFLAPRTSYVEVAINGQESLMLIQEKVVKEFLEGSNRREGPIFEGDEKYLFNNYNEFDHYDLIDLSLGKMSNQRWAEASSIATNISLNAFSLIQSAYLHFSNTADNTYALDWSILSNNNEALLTRWAAYEMLLFATQASHALIPHNRKFYFNTFYSGLEPVYWDGHSRSLDGTWMRIRPDFRFYPHLQIEHFEYLENLIDGIDPESFISAIEEENILEIEESYKIIRDTLFKVRKLKEEYLLFQGSFINLSKVIQPRKDLLGLLSINSRKYLEDGYIISVGNSSNSSGLIQLDICNLDLLNCKSEIFNFKELGALLNNKNLGEPFKDVPNFLIPDRDQFFLEKENYYNFRNGMINITSSSTSKITFNEDLDELDIYLTNTEDWVLIHESNLENVSIALHSAIPLDSKSYKHKESGSDVRINRRGLSGCLSIYKSTLKNVNFNVNGVGSDCEDLVNIINTTGHIKEFILETASSDGLDVDFSTLVMESVNINGAKNDCVDFSKGRYRLDSGIFKNCGDKGISIGEQSSAEVGNLNIDNTHIAISSKDSSITSFKNVFIKNSDICLESYQKKQEFFGSFTSVNNLNCNSNKIEKDNNSRVKLNEF